MEIDRCKAWLGKEIALCYGLGQCMMTQIISRIKDDSLGHIREWSWKKRIKTSYINARSITVGQCRINKEIEQLSNDKLVDMIKDMKY